MLTPRFSLLNKLSTRLVTALLLVVLLAVVGMGLTAFMTERATLYNETIDALEAVLATKSTDIQRWVGDREIDVNFLAKNLLNQTYLTEISTSDSDIDLKNRSRMALRENLLSMQRTQPYYKRIDIANADGVIKISTDEDATNQVSTHISQDTFLNTIRKSNEIFIQDMYAAPDNDAIYMQFSHTMHGVDPVTGKESDNVIGIVVITVDVAESFFPMLENYQLLGETGEIVLGRNEGNETVILNNLRFATEDTALVTSLPHNASAPSPIQIAADGGRGMLETADLDQKPTLFAYNAVPEMKWGLVVKMDRAEALAPLWALLKWLSIISLILLACAAFFAIRLWYRIAQPINYLATAIESVANGDLAVDVQIMNDDEMGVLAESFRDMLESLRSRRIDLHYATKAVEITEHENTQLVMQLRQLNTDLEHIVYDRTEELSVANSKLKLLDELKSKFISNVSHELRNPVASLKLYVNLLNKSNDSNRERYLNAIGRQIDILSHLVENVLDISHLENENMKIMLSPCDLNFIAQRVVESNRPRAEEAGLELLLATHDEQTVVSGSASKLMQLITNLVTNALNYTEAGNISVEISSVGQDAVITVEDTGIGIPKEDMPHLFERFYRGHNVNELEIRGTGLGLGIVKEVVDLHNGTIMVESEEGNGTRFQIMIPLTTSAYMPQTQVMESGELIG